MYPNIDLKQLASLVIKEIKNLKGDNRLDITHIKNGENLARAAARPTIDMSDMRWHGGGDTIEAGTNISIDDIDGVKVINAAGGSGSPGGSDTNIQFNDSGSFGGSDDFIWSTTGSHNFLTLGSVAKSPVIRSADGSSSDGAALDILSGGGNGGDGGQLNITAGDGDTGSNGGALDSRAGNGGSGATGGNYFATAGTGDDGGDIVISGGPALVNGGDAGDVILNAGDANTGDTNGGDIVFSPGTKTGTGHNGDTIVNANATSIATTANGGFLVIPTCSGPATGTPTYAGSMVFDKTNFKLYIWTGATWKSVLLS